LNQKEINSIKFKQYVPINKKLYEDASNPLRSHGPDHHWRVYLNAKKIVKKSGLEVDWKILTPACLIHDLAAYYPEEVGDNYHEEDVKRSAKVLKDMDYPEKEIEEILAAIGAHGSGEKYKEQRDTNESVVLCDADKLDVFGPLGIARVIMVKTLRGADLEEIIKDFWTDGHMQRKWDAITLEVSKDLGRKDYEYSMSFLKKMAEELEV
jgi:HD superfamily phosphodiesterase